MTTDKGIRFIEPTKALRHEFMAFLQEFREAGETEQPPGSCWKDEDDFATFLRRVRDYARGENTPDGWVPDSAYWLVCGRRIIGACDIRHRLTAALLDFGGHVGYGVRPTERRKGYGTLMLKLALQKARRLGIDRVRITCDKNNIGSVRVIQKNGGVLDSESYSGAAGRVTQRYWIDLAAEGAGR